MLPLFQRLDLALDGHLEEPSAGEDMLHAVANDIDDRITTYR